MDEIFSWVDEHGVKRCTRTTRTGRPLMVTSFSMPYGGGVVVPHGYRLAPGPDGRRALVKIEDDE